MENVATQPSPVNDVEARAETDILGAVLLDPDRAVPAVQEVLGQEDFGHPLLGRIYAAALDQFTEEGHCDVLTLAARLAGDHELQDAGGVVYLTDLHSGVASAANARHHADIVLRAARRRRHLAGLAEATKRLQAGEDLTADLLAGLQAMPTTNGRPHLRCMADVAPETATWLWHPRIPAGELTLLFGDGGVGKSHVCLALATALSVGAGLPGAEGTGTPATSLVFTGEDSLGEARRRLDAMGADSRHVYACGEAFGLDAAGLAFVGKAIRDHGAELAILDPVVAFLGRDLDFFRANEVRAVLAPLAAIAHDTGAAIVLSTHVTKGTAARAAHRAIGSGDFVNAARSALLAGSDPDDIGSRALCHVKSNYAAPAPPLGYSIRDGRFTWTGSTDLTASRILGGEATDEERSVGSQAEDLLRELCQTEVRASEVEAQAQAEGISRRTLYRAAGKFCAKRREGVGTPDQVVYWRLRRSGESNP